MKLLDVLIIYISWLRLSLLTDIKPKGRQKFPTAQMLLFYTLQKKVLI
jgi:hypothetical protein